MSYRLTMEVRDNEAMEQFQREFDQLTDAKLYAHDQVRGDIYWTVREGHLDGLAPNYAFRIEDLTGGNITADQA